MNDDLLAELLREVRGMREALNAHIDREDSLLPKIGEGVPGGDWEAHRRYHESLIQRNEWKARLYQDLVAHIAKWGAISIITLLFVWVAWSFTHWGQRP